MTTHQGIEKIPSSYYKVGKIETRRDFTKGKSPGA